MTDKKHSDGTSELRQGSAERLHMPWSERQGPRGVSCESYLVCPVCGGEGIPFRAKLVRVGTPGRQSDCR